MYFKNCFQFAGANGLKRFSIVMFFFSFSVIIHQDCNTGVSATVPCSSPNPTHKRPVTHEYCQLSCRGLPQYNTTLHYEHALTYTYTKQVMTHFAAGELPPGACRGTMYLDEAFTLVNPFTATICGMHPPHQTRDPTNPLGCSRGRDGRSGS